MATGIISLAAAIFYFAYSAFLPKIQASRVLADYHATRNAFRMYMSDTELFQYPEGRDFNATSSPFASCENELDDPPLSHTDLFQDLTGRPGWKGPYLPRVPRTPWGDEYQFDNDDNTYPDDGKRAGVNLRLVFCSRTDANKNRNMVKYIDEKLDQNDGSETGLVRWSTGDTGVISILMSPNEHAQ